MAQAREEREALVSATGLKGVGEGMEHKDRCRVLVLKLVSRASSEPSVSSRQGARWHPQSLSLVHYDAAIKGSKLKHVQSVMHSSWLDVPPRASPGRQLK